MTSHNKDADQSAFSYRVKVGHVSANPVQVHVEADARERAALADLWKVEAVNRLKADLQINRWKKDGIRIRGQVDGELVQACVVTLEPVVTEIRQEIDQIFVPEGSKLARIVTDEAGEMILDPDGPDLPETFVGDTIEQPSASIPIRRSPVRNLPDISKAMMPRTGDHRPSPC